MTVECRELFKVHRTADGDAAALQGLTLAAAAGEMVAVLGPSGSGKTTLLRILAGLEEPSAGAALVAGRDMARLGARERAAVRRAHIGLVGQHAERALSPALAVAEAVALPLRLRGASRRDAAARAAALLERVGLRDAGAARPGELSGGERQRVAVCAAVAHEPAVVLADEPTGELDARAATDVLGLLRQLADGGATVVLVTHDPVGATVAGRVVRVRDGRVSHEGTADRLEVVVGRGGWLHVPEELLAGAGIGGLASVRAERGAVILEPAGGAAEAAPTPAPDPPAHRVEPVPVVVRDVDKRYGRRTVFERLAADLRPGRFTAVTGRSGSGKSTLLRLVAGLERPDGGSIRVGGLDVAATADRERLAAFRARHVGVVAQAPALLGFLTATEQVALAGDPEPWLAAVGLGERAAWRVDRLSGGERQRVAIARALAGGRGLVLVDEPTSRLDEANAAVIAEVLRRAAHDHGATVVCATHDPVVVAAADEEIRMDPAARIG